MADSNTSNAPDILCTCDEHVVLKILQISLVTLLARSDIECLLSELKTLQNHTSTSVSNKAELQALCGHLQTVRSASHSLLLAFAKQSCSWKVQHSALPGTKGT